MAAMLNGSTQAAAIPSTASSQSLRLRDFGGGPGRDVANDDALEALLSAVQARIGGRGEVNDRVPGIRVLLDPGVHRFTRPIQLQDTTIQFVGEDTIFVFEPQGGADAFVELGSADWLRHLDRGYRRIDFDGVTIDARSGHVGCAIRNRGMRSIGLRRCHVLGGEIGFQSEGAYAALDLDTVFFQSQSDIGVHLLRRNNLAALHRVSVLGGGKTKTGFLLESAGAEMGAVLLSMTDAEGCQTGYRIAGDNLGNILLMNSWAELCPVSVDVVNAPRTNIYGVQILGGQFDGTVRFGSSSMDGLLRGCGIGGGAKMSNGKLEIGVPTGVCIGDVVLTGESRIIHAHAPDQLPQRLGPYGLSPSAERQARYDVGHEVPRTSGDQRGIIGDIRWDEQRLYVQTHAGWRTFAGTRFEDDTLPPLAGNATPDVSGMTSCIASGGGEVAKLIGGYAGQRVLIVGGEGGRILKSGAMKFPGNKDVTLRNGDIIELLCLGHGQWISVRT